MCGIAGFIGSKARQITSNASAINHRGPDDEGYFVDDNVWLAHKRLSIVDLSHSAHQPMVSSDGNYVLVYNGEIYNHLDFRSDLISKGYPFTSSSDTQTLLYGLVHYGAEIIPSLNGIFAFAFYDIKEQTVIIARDQFGIKPLYYFSGKGSFAFASEIKALLNLPDFSNQIDHNALFFYLQMLYAPGEITPFRHVRKLLPGHFIKYNVNKAKIETQRYFQLNFEKPSQERSEAVLIDELDEHLTRAVERQLMSDVPLGYFLSGGLDSSLLVAIAKKVSPSNSFNCFTIATGDDMGKEGFSDDLTYAQKVAKYLSVDLDVIPASQNIEHFFDKMIWHLDEPQADPAPLHVYNIAYGARKKGIKVLMGGTGGDDLFSGYRRHQAINAEGFLRYAPSWVLQGLKNSSRYLTASNPSTRRMKKLIGEFAKTKEERLAGYFTWSSTNTICGLFTEETKRSLKENVLPTNYWKALLQTLPEGTADLDKMLFLEMQTFLPDHNLNYTDKMSMAASVEARVPYLDLDLVNFATSLPVKYKMKGNTTKYLLKKVAERYLPHEVIYRPKTGFGAPVRTWLKTSLKPMMEERLSTSKLNDKGIFNPQAVSALIDSTLTGKTDSSYTIWSLMAIDSWMDQFGE